MARDFTRAASEYLAILQAVAPGEPFAVSCMFNTDNTTVDIWLVSLADGGVTNQYHALALNTTGGVPDAVTAHSRDAVTWSRAETTIPYVGNAWQHACALFPSATDRRVFLEGGNKGTNSTSRTIAGLDKTTIGTSADSTPGDYMAGYIAEVGIWDLSVWPGATPSAQADEFERVAVPALAKGYAPSFFPLGLVAYWKLVRDEDQDLVNRYNMTAYNTPGIAAHPPGMIYPSVPGIENWSHEFTLALAGTLTSSGALTKKTSKPLVGTLTSAGALVKKTLKPLSGTLTSSGILATVVTFRMALAGTLTSSGILIKKTLKPLAGTLTSSGTLIKKTLKPLSGVLTSAGTVVGQVVFRQFIAGVGTSSGILVKKTLKSLQGVGTSAGAVTKRTMISMSGVGTSAGALVKKTLKSLAGTLTSSGVVTTAGRYALTLTGTLTSSGTLIKKTLKSLGGTGTSSGILTTVASIAALLVSSFVRAVRSGWFLPIPAYDTFTRANGALGSTELVGPDGQRIPAVLWNNRIGTTLIVGNTASASVLVGGVAIATVVGTLVDVWAIAPLTRVGGDVGVVVRYADVNNYVIAYHDGANAHLDKVVGGVTTPVLNVVSAYAAGRVIRLICEGTAFRLYYNDLLIGTAVIADAGVQNGVEYGLYSTNVGNSQADITVVPRGSGEYSKLDTWGRDNP